MMVPFVLSLLAILGGFGVAARRSRRAYQFAGAALAALGIACAVWSHPARAALTNQQKLDDAMCKATGREVERFASAGPAPASLAALMARARTVGARPDPRFEEAQLKAAAGMMLHKIVDPVITECVPAEHHECEVALDEAAPFAALLWQDSSESGRLRAARALTSSLIMHACPSAASRTRDARR
jgi:hypothetical protein